MIESIIKTSIQKRWLVMVAVLVLIALGLWNVRNLPIDAVPDITNVQVQINTNAPGYSPLETEQRITYPVETALAGIPNLAYTRSLSRYALSQVTVVFEEGTDIYFARNLINERLGAIKSRLPEGLTPEMGPITSGLGEIFMYTVEAEPGYTKPDGSRINAIELREIQDWIIKPQLALVKGVTEVNSIGGYNKQYHVNPSPEKMLNYGISFQDIEQALQQNNLNQGAGYIETNGQQILVRSPGQLKTIHDIEHVVVKTFEYAPIKIKDIATVNIGKQLRSGAATKNGAETVLGTAMMLVGENSRAVAHSVAQKVQEISGTLPEGVLINPVYDRTTLVDKAIWTVEKNLTEGALLVIVILFVLLGNFRAALITAAVIPIVMLVTISGMVEAGVSANLMSLGALDFGLIVDGAVIIMENSIRRLAEAQKEQGKLPLKERLEVVFNATNEVIRPSLFGVIIITVVYIPLFSLTGVEGKMFHPMAATVVMALLAALVLSFTFIPSAVAIFMNGKVSEKESILIRATKSIYRPMLKGAIKLRWLVLFGAMALVGFSGWLYTTMGSEFIPELDEGDLLIHAIRIPGTGLDQVVKMQFLLEEKLAEFPEVEDVFSKSGTPEIANDPMPPNVTDTFVILKPYNQWTDSTLTKQGLIEKIEHVIKQLPGNNYEFTQPIQMRFNELISGVRADLGIKIFGDDLDLLLKSGNDILSILNQIEGVADARVEQITNLPMLSIVPKRDSMALYGLHVADVQYVIKSAIGGTGAGVVYEGDRQFEIVVRLDEDSRRDINYLNALPVPLTTGGYVPLSEVAEIILAPAPNQISRENGKRRVVVTANVRDRDLGSFVDEAKTKITTEVKLPAGYWLDYGGTFEQLESANKRLSIVVPITLAIIFGLLVMAFSSFKDALIIFSGVPLALTGGIISLWLRGMPLSISAGVGFIALSGVAVLNGLVMLSFMRELWKQTGELYHSVIQGAMTRLRPVLMTALVASLGFVPMALNTGIGSEVQRPLATVVIGGIISSTILTLFVLPILYHFIHREKN
ncbi:efflux RND transporter permease subunit [Marinicella gelatinilytica]|uniref:efflux RND transporter permease subunit n=1 Tax=Marinicella gelatinilytica TaxID=2996017 RepID=UPI002260D9B8|nr:CusA/CzcA family heavy metal efflux RND transporter [Marinicella gelatinilytica]MCX7543881.1 CusA/CzcA family heavy metal efflux RND transporter [Marinicella gelatinilytica]